MILLSDLPPVKGDEEYTPQGVFIVLRQPLPMAIANAGHETVDKFEHLREIFYADHLKKPWMAFSG